MSLTDSPKKKKQIQRKGAINLRAANFSHSMSAAGAVIFSHSHSHTTHGEEFCQYAFMYQAVEPSKINGASVRAGKS